MTCKAKEYIHRKAIFVKGTGYFINEDFQERKERKLEKSKTIEK